MAGRRPLAIDPAFSRFIVRKRGAQSVQSWFEEHHTGLRLSSRSRASYINLEDAKRGPWPHEVAYLTGLYGEMTEEDRAAPTAAATPDLVAVLASLSAELAAMRQEREALWKGIAAVLRSDEGGRAAAALSDALVPLLPGGVRP